VGSGLRLQCLDLTQSKEKKMSLVSKTEFHITLPNFEVERFPKGFKKDDLPDDLKDRVGDHVWEETDADAPAEVVETTAQEDSLSGKTVAELRVLAASLGIEVHSNKKSEIVEAIRGAQH